MGLETLCDYHALLDLIIGLKCPSDVSTALLVLMQALREKPAVDVDPTKAVSKQRSTRGVLGL